MHRFKQSSIYTCPAAHFLVGWRKELLASGKNYFERESDGEGPRFCDAQWNEEFLWKSKPRSLALSFPSRFKGKFSMEMSRPISLQNRCKFETRDAKQVDSESDDD